MFKNLLKAWKKRRRARSAGRDLAVLVLQEAMEVTEWIHEKRSESLASMPRMFFPEILVTVHGFSLVIFEHFSHEYLEQREREAFMDAVFSRMSTLGVVAITQGGSMKMVKAMTSWWHSEMEAASPLLSTYSIVPNESGDGVGDKINIVQFLARFLAIGAFGPLPEYGLNSISAIALNPISDGHCELMKFETVPKAEKVIRDLRQHLARALGDAGFVPLK